MTSPKDPESPAQPARRRGRRPGHFSTVRLRRAHDYARALKEELKALASPRNEDASQWTPHLAEVQRLLETLERVPAPDGTRALGPTPEQRLAFGQLLRDRRSAAGLSRGALAQRARLSDATVKFIETAHHPPSRSTLIRLVGVEALGLTWDDVAAVLDPTAPPPGSAAADRDVAPQAPERAVWFIADDFDWLRLVSERDRMLRGAGGFVPAGLAYVDPHNAIEYMAYLSHCPPAFEPRASLPLAALVEHVVADLSGSPLQILALGAGDGQTELRLAYGLLDQLRTLHIELWLIDQSLPLLCVAARRATALLGAHPRIRLRLLAEDVQQLARHAALVNPGPAQPRRLYTLLGGMLADLDNEARFLRHGLLGAAPGDLLLLDIQVAAATADKPDEILRRERLLREPVPALLRDWLTGSIWRADREVGSIDLRVELDAHGEFPGSYGLPVVAQVRSRSRAERRFVLYQFKRHVPEALVAFLRDCGWALVTQVPYGQDRRSLALLCRRMSDELATR